MDWPLPPEDSEDTVRPDVAAALSDALTACGKVAFRYDGPLAGAEISIPPAPRSVANRLLDIAGLGGDAFGLAVASDPMVVAALFAYGGGAMPCNRCWYSIPMPIPSRSQARFAGISTGAAAPSRTACVSCSAPATTGTSP